MPLSRLEDITFAFLDVETTGLSPYAGDKICEIGILKVRNGKRCRFFHSLVNPERQLSTGAYLVNGITLAMLKGKPRFNQIASRILKMLEGAVIVCHNAPFDLGFLKSEFNALGINIPNWQVVDTLALARSCFMFYNNSLTNIAECLGIRVKQSHRAMSDCITTQKVFQRFMEKFKTKGIIRLEEILSLQNNPSLINREIKQTLKIMGGRHYGLQKIY